MTEYMKVLRAHVGHSPIIQCGASVIVEDENGRILLGLRTDNECWSYPGGSVELGESVEETAARELFEEMGLIAEELELFGVFSGEGLHYVYPNGDEVHNIDIVFVCKKYRGELKADPVEMKTLNFFAIDNMPENISPPIKKSLLSYIEARAKL